MESIENLVKKCETEIEASQVCVNINKYSSLCREEEWTEYCGGVGKKVKGTIWTEAFTAALRENGRVYVPQSDAILYIDAPIVLASGGVLWVHPKTRIFLRPGVNTCMVRNACADTDGTDEDIVIRGGIWSTLTHDLFGVDNNGNDRGRSSKGAEALSGSHGVFLIRNAAGVVLSGMTITECAAFGMQLNACRKFLVENITFRDHKRDGVHMGGEVYEGEIRNIQGHTNDDLIALNAWDWNNYIMTYGNIADIYVHDIYAVHDQIRFLAGKHGMIECSISRIHLRNIQGIDNIKMYPQPNSESLVLYGKEDRSESAGEICDVLIENLRASAPRMWQSDGLVEIGSHVKNLRICDVVIDCEESLFTENKYPFVRVGPKSATIVVDKDRPETWVEIFEPNAIGIAENLKIEGLKFGSEPWKEKTNVVAAVALQKNADYPKTTPQGGTGYGKIILVEIE